MATPRLTPQELQDIRDTAAQWGKIVARRAFGGAGPGLDVDLLALEQVATAAARGLTEGTLATLLEQQAQALPADWPCPDCGQLGPVDREPRPLTGHGGTLSYREPICSCPACRRDFFPPTARPAPPQPVPPPAFRDARRVARLAQQLQGLSAPPADEPAAADPATDPPPATDDADRPGKPQRLVRTCVASMNTSRASGPLVAGEAQARAFFGAPRRAFWGDGQHYNWQIQRAWFPHFVAITDFWPVVCYLYRAA